MSNTENKREHRKGNFYNTTLEKFTLWKMNSWCVYVKDLEQVAWHGTINIKTEKGIYRIGFQEAMNEGRMIDIKGPQVAIPKKCFIFTPHGTG